MYSYILLQYLQIVRPLSQTKHKMFLFSIVITAPVICNPRLYKQLQVTSHKPLTSQLIIAATCVGHSGDKSDPRFVRDSGRRTGGYRLVGGVGEDGAKGCRRRALAPKPNRARAR